MGTHPTEFDVFVCNTTGYDNISTQIILEKQDGVSQQGMTEQGYTKHDALMFGFFIEVAVTTMAVYIDPLGIANGMKEGYQEGDI